MDNYSQGINYLTINLAVGLGIAADAMIATLGRFRQFDNRLSALKWASAIGLTHWLFPMVGFVGGWYFAMNTRLAATIYALGAVVMFTYVASVVRRASSFSSTNERKQGFYGAVWAVSIDALVTGPGKTAATAHWTSEQVWLSFAIVGIVVFGLVLSAAFVAVRLQDWVRRATKQSLAFLVAFNISGIWVELAIFAWFAFLAVAESLRVSGRDLHSAWVFAADGAFLLLLVVVSGRKIVSTQKHEAVLAVGRETI